MLKFNHWYDSKGAARIYINGLPVEKMYAVEVENGGVEFRGGMERDAVLDALEAHCGDRQAAECWLTLLRMTSLSVWPMRFKFNTLNAAVEYQLKKTLVERGRGLTQAEINAFAKNFHKTVTAIVSCEGILVEKEAGEKDEWRICEFDAIEFLHTNLFPDIAKTPDNKEFLLDLSCRIWQIDIELYRNAHKKLGA